MLRRPLADESPMARTLGLRIGLGYLAAALLMFLAGEAFTSGIGGCRGLGTTLMHGATVAILALLGVAILAHPLVGGVGCLIAGGTICLNIPLLISGPISAFDAVLVILAAASCWVAFKLIRTWSDERHKAGSASTSQPESSPAPR